MAVDKSCLSLSLSLSLLLLVAFMGDGGGRLVVTPFVAVGNGTTGGKGSSIAGSRAYVSASREGGMENAPDFWKMGAGERVLFCASRRAMSYSIERTFRP